MSAARNQRYELWRWRIFAITWLAYAGFYLTRRSFDIAKIGMQEDPDILLSTAQLSTLDSVYLTSYAVGQFVWGISGDRFGARKVVLVGMVCSVLVAVTMGFSSGLAAFGVCMLIQGLCQATGWSPLAKNIGSWFSRSERGRVMGWWCTHYAVGGAVAALLAGGLAEIFGSWRYAFFGGAGGLVVVGVLFWWFQRNRPEDVGLPSVEEYKGEPEEEQAESEGDEPRQGAWQNVTLVLRNPMVLTLCGVYFFLKPIRYAILRWIPSFIDQSFGTGLGETALISISFELAGPLGVLAAGYLSDKVFGARRMPISAIFLLVLAVLLFVIHPLAGLQSKTLMAAMLFACGFLLFGPDSLVSGTAAIDFGTKRAAATAAGFINGAGSVGAILGGSLPGLVAERWGWGVLFTALGLSVLMAAALLLPHWNALPGAAKKAA